MADSDERKRTRSEPAGALKPPEGQVEEIEKLVADAQEKLDQVSRALRSLGERLTGEGEGPRR